MHRRRFIAAATVAGSGAIAGCFVGDGSTPSEPTATTSVPADAPAIEKPTDNLLLRISDFSERGWDVGTTNENAIEFRKQDGKYEFIVRSSVVVFETKAKAERAFEERERGVPEDNPTQETSIGMEAIAFKPSYTGAWVVFRDANVVGEIAYIILNVGNAPEKNATFDTAIGYAREMHSHFR